MEKFKVDNVTHVAATEMFFVIPTLEISPLKFKKAVHNFKIFFPVLYPILYDSWLYIYSTSSLYTYLHKINVQVAAALQ